MIEPERWYEYQKSYQRYGFDMKPQPERKVRTQRKRTIKKVSIPFGNGKKIALSMVLAVGIVMIGLIIVTAYSANVRYNINTVIKENQALMGEIENLQVKVYSANNVDYIEGKATGELGMTYPETASRVYITMEDIPEDGFADMLKEKAYN
ncbi:MAG: cell division protein FtsL [Bacillota bacterium]|nr:cell division protein FtsL [Bacillota bacterium]